MSFVVLIVIASHISIYRINVVQKHEIAWDVLEYYLYFPATFVHHDPMLKDISWLKKENEGNKLAGTLYMVSQNKAGEPMFFSLMGMALFYLPFLESPYNEITQKDQVWVKASLDIRFPDHFEGQLPDMVMTMKRKI